MSKSISTKLLISILASISTLIIIFSLYDYFEQEKYYKSKQHFEITNSGARLQLNLPRSIWNIDSELTSSIISSEKKLQYINEIIYYEEKLNEKTKLSSPYIFELVYEDGGVTSKLGYIEITKDDTSIEKSLNSLLI